MSGLNELVKSQIALLAGDDLDDEEQVRDVRRNIESCPHCRQHWIRLRGCVDVLERAGRSADLTSGASLWPSLESRLQRSSCVRAGKFNGWVPALSMAAACIALLIAGQLDGLSPQEMHAGDQAMLFTGDLSPVSPPPVRPFGAPARQEPLGSSMFSVGNPLYNATPPASDRASQFDYELMRLFGPVQVELRR